MSGRGITPVLGTALAAFLAAGFIPLATSPVAHACVTDGSASVCDMDFISSTTNFFGLLSNSVAADSGVLSNQLLGIENILTSLADRLDSLTSVPGLADIETAGIGVAPLVASLVAPAIPCVTDDSAPVCDTDFVSSTINFFGLLSNTVAADPGDNGFVATVFSSPLLGIQDILTSGADPSNSLAAISGLADIGTAGIGMPGETVNTLITPFFETTFAVPITDPLAALFTDLVALLAGLGL